MSASQNGKTPRRTTRRSTATPVRDVSPPAHNTRATSSGLVDTPATRRSTRATSQKPDQQSELVSNDALPEIQTRQSYAYGSSKTPLLPEQLHVRDPLTMRQVADQMENAMTQVEQDIDRDAADLSNNQRQSQPPPEKTRVTRRTSRQPSSPVSVTTDVQKKQRTAAWASSLETGPLEDIAEEQQQQLDTPETRRTEPSSFPSGIFDQSYQYERGLRLPRRPPKPSQKSIGARLGALFDRFVSTLSRGQQVLIDCLRAIGRWFARLFGKISDVLLEIPDSRFVVALTKLFFIVTLMGLMSYSLCFVYSRFLCNPLSTSQLSQTLESWCGVCQASTHNYTGLPLNADIDIRKLTSALKHIDGQIRNLESRFNSRLDNQVSAIHTDINSLRKEQSNLIQQLDHIESRPNQRSSSDVASPLIPKINYFSPANGAIINPYITSPTRQAPISLPFRLMTRVLGIKKYRPHNPITALEVWNDVGDCWCAAASAPGQDSIRLGVGVQEYIYPTELVIEHPSKETTLTPETAPRHIELWAHFGHLNQQDWTDLGIDEIVKGPGGETGPFGKTFGLLASVEYTLGRHGDHLQAFALDVNQHGRLRYGARDFAVRVRSTHGGEYGCLYRVRLHGVAVDMKKNSPVSDNEAEPVGSMDSDEVVS